MKKCVFYLLLSITCLACNDSSTTQTSRLTEDFNQNWKFFLGNDTLAYQTEYDDSSWRNINLPHDWSIESDFSEEYPATPGGGALSGGIGWYRKDFVVEDIKDKNIFIDFDGIYWNSKVWINGHLVGYRPNGYVSFRYDLTPYIKPGEINVIAVQADNSKQPNSRWYTGSGMYRNVKLVSTNKIHIDQYGVFITTPSVSSDKASVVVSTKIKNTKSEPQYISISQNIIDKNEQPLVESRTDKIYIGALKDTTITNTLNINNPTLWSVENPYLYKLETKILDNKKVIDEEITSFGVRDFHFDSEQGFFLNGENIKIKGVCMHHDLGALGAAVNVRAMERQLEILKEMGCNGIRTSHNPAAPEFLDLCDKMGFIVMEDIFDMWAKKKSPHDYGEYFTEWHEKDLTDVVLRDRNHPSIFMWNIGNEILEQWADINTDTLSLQQANMMFNFASKLSKNTINDSLHVNSLLTISLVNIVKAVDSTRPITTGNNEAGQGNLLIRSGAMDLLGFNYNDKKISELPNMYPGKQYIITESTSSLMSRGFYEMPSDKALIRPERWDKPYDRPIRQCSSYDNSYVPWGTTHERSWNLVKNNPYMSGLFVWTGFDYLGEPTPFWWPARSSYFGIVDLAGIPKDVYYMYQSEWTNKDVLHIFPHWNWKEGDTVDIWAYYNNADEVELFVNGKSLGRKHKERDNLHVYWRVPYVKGTIKAISYKDGKEVQKKEIKTARAPVSIRLTADRNTITSDGKDLSFVTVEVLDATGYPVPTAEHLIDFTIEGDGFIAGTDNGDPTNHKSLKHPSRNLFAGKAIAIIQSTNKSGNIKLTAKSEGLKDASIVLNSKKD